ncbi:MAG: phage holin family protein [Bacteroidetes bacterium]|nr:phage holin family protein [Bacteroidota bacterium]
MNESIKELARDLKEYIELRFDWIAINASEVLSHLVSIILQKVFAILLLGIALFFLLFALAEYLGALMGNPVFGYLSIGSVLLLLSLFFLSNSPKFFFSRMKESLTHELSNKLLVKKKDHEQ